MGRKVKIYLSKYNGYENPTDTIKFVRERQSLYTAFLIQTMFVFGWVVGFQKGGHSDFGQKKGYVLIF